MKYSIKKSMKGMKTQVQEAQRTLSRMNEKPQLGLSKSSGSQTKDDDKA